MYRADPESLTPPSSFGTLPDPVEPRTTREPLPDRQQLAHVNRVATLGEMSASIAHELSQPLAAVTINAASSLRGLTRSDPDLPTVIRYIRKILRDAERATRMIQRIRALAQNSKPEMSQLDINGVVEEVVTFVKQEASRRRVSLRLEIERPLSPVHGDVIQLQQVVLNLVVNGIQAMASVTDRSRELLIRTRQHDYDTALVAVEDAGVGTNVDDLDQLFSAFYSTKPDGMGMGLAISRSIIEAHRGRIWAARNSGPGMTFQFTIPICPNCATAPPASSIASDASNVLCES